MEIRRLLLCTAFFVVAVVSHCSEARHSLQRRQADEKINNDEEPRQADEASDDDTPNDTDTAGTNETPKKFITAPTTYEANITSDLVLECKVSPDEDTVVNWYKDNELYFTGRMKLQTSATRCSLVANTHNLAIKNLEPGDAGTYRCELMSDKPISISHTVVVLSPPKISSTNETPTKPSVKFITAPTIYEANSNSDLVLECKVSPDEDTVVNWYKDNELYFTGRMKLQTSATRCSLVANTHNLAIKNLEPGDAGTYRCELMSDKPISISHTVVVLSPPKISSTNETPTKPSVKFITAPTTYEANSNSDLVLECKVSPDEGKVVNWYKDNELYFMGKIILQTSATRRSLVANTHNLAIKNLEPGDAGTYRCELMSDKPISISHTVVVLSPPKISKARHSLQRRQADEEINYDEEPQQADEASDDDTQNDTDTAVSVTNETPKKPSAKFITAPTTYEANITSDLVLECKVSPDERTVVNWYKNDDLYFMGSMKLQTTATRHSLVANTHNLAIKNLEPGDAGTYRCDLMNDKPISITHTVVVLTPPKVLRFVASNNGSVKEGSDVLLTCDVSGIPPPNIVWSRDENGENRRLEERDGEFSYNTVFLKNLKREDSGEYYCYALNTAGNSQRALNITVYGKPRVRVHKTVVNSAINVEAILECSTHEDTKIHIRWYKDSKLIEDTSSRFTVSTNGSRSNLTVVPSSDDDFGTFTCEAENPHGNHNRSIELVQRPVLEDFSSEGAKLMWTVHSHQALEAIEVQVKELEGESDWQQLKVPLPEIVSRKYEMVYNLDDANLQPGKYEAIVKVKNTHSWSGNSEPVLVEIEARPQYIQHASVFRQNNAHSIRTSSVILPTILMYLLVRMF